MNKCILCWHEGNSAELHNMGDYHVCPRCGQRFVGKIPVHAHDIERFRKEKSA